MERSIGRRRNENKRKKDTVDYHFQHGGDWLERQPEKLLISLLRHLNFVTIREHYKVQVPGINSGPEKRNGGGTKSMSKSRMGKFEKMHKLKNPAKLIAKMNANVFIYGAPKLLSDVTLWSAKLGQSL